MAMPRSPARTTKVISNTPRPTSQPIGLERAEVSLLAMADWFFVLSDLRHHPVAVDLRPAPVEKTEQDVVFRGVDSECAEVFGVSFGAARHGRGEELVFAVAAEAVDEIDQPIGMDALVDVVVPGEHGIHTPLVKRPAHMGGLPGMSAVEDAGR